MSAPATIALEPDFGFSLKCFPGRSMHAGLAVVVRRMLADIYLA
jgi:hypothetical protein